MSSVWLFFGEALDSFSLKASAFCGKLFLHSSLLVSARFNSSHKTLLFASLLNITSSLPLETISIHSKPCVISLDCISIWPCFLVCGSDIINLQVSVKNSDLWEQLFVTDVFLVHVSLLGFCLISFIWRISSKWHPNAISLFSKIIFFSCSALSSNCNFCISLEQCLILLSIIICFSLVSLHWFLIKIVDFMTLSTFSCCFFSPSRTFFISLSTSLLLSCTCWIPLP